MKKITEPNLKSARIMKAAEMNQIHFGGNHTPLSPEKLKAFAATLKPKE